MIQHCVFLRFKASTQETEKLAIYQGIAALKNIIPGMLEVKYGPNVSPEGLHGGYLDGFIITFEDTMVRDYYLKHPDHIAVGDRIVKATDGGLSGILVFDMEI
ncbi:MULTISPECIES: Dabb family protein [Alphaproteobacteria]|uniref:Stress responsive protein n=2 Tax=Alphaproteobacteria TaxID=28211 RepID=A0A512HFG0_9HYPH|nr:MULTISPECIES: Dabb family protein [Alphaproteobacteria]GEO84178.1 stress responsive protein [Ciceribacter naphthalenivorans]GLR24714.1 stress responsive protein [Ciceribacter naphthalenivorans]GLT07570.1 stress responsive protein [Sphingomonas psychrolutea]